MNKFTEIRLAKLLLLGYDCSSCEYGNAADNTICTYHSNKLDWIESPPERICENFNHIF